jgi:hypothetical protein
MHPLAQKLFILTIAGAHFCMEMSAAAPVCNCASIHTRRQFYEYIIPKIYRLTCWYKICYKLMLTYSTVQAILVFLFSSQNVVQLRERYQAVADQVANKNNRFL